ncbi:MAG: HAD-IIA family hydrolase [Nocardioidaceae bacterium]
MTPAAATLHGCSEPLCVRYDCAMLDLDGVVYRGTAAIPGVPDRLRRASEAGMTLAFVTNNAARTPEGVASQLRDLGIDASSADVVTSAQAAAREVATRVPAGARVLVVGGEGLEVALREHGLAPVASLSDDPAAVVQGFHPDVGWRQLAEAAYAVAADVPWVASNLDMTVPTAAGIAPGNGSLVAAVAAAVGHGPDVVAGKPHRPLFDETLLRIGAERPLVVGDRLDTDIEGANRCGADSLLVMTGVTDVAALCRAGPAGRPSYVAWTLDGLLTPHAAPELHHGVWRCEDWVVSIADGALTVNEPGADRAVGLRAVTAAAWRWYDDREPVAGAAEELDITDACRTLRAS